MRSPKSLSYLVWVIIVLGIFASSMGIFYDQVGESYTYTSIRGEEITIYGKGLYRHMSADVAIQGIAQDYVTLFIGIPFLIGALFLLKRKPLLGKLLLSGTLFYFLLTYLFYTAMGTYNEVFLVYTSLLCFSFVAFVMTLLSFDLNELKRTFQGYKPLKWTSRFLIFNSFLVAFLWLSSIIPPLLDGTLYPEGLDHYTTIIVQGFDLGLFLPMSFIAGLLALKKNLYGYLFAPVYAIFMCFLMTALTSKLLFMANAGAQVIPAIFIMPTIGLVAIYLSTRLLKKTVNL